MSTDQHTADTTRPGVRAGLGALAAARMVYDAGVAVVETAGGLCIVGYLIAIGEFGSWRWARVQDETAVRSALEAAGPDWSTAEQLRSAAGLTARRSGNALRRLIRRGRVIVSPAGRHHRLRTYRLRTLGIVDE